MHVLVGRGVMQDGHHESAGVEVKRAERTAAVQVAQDLRTLAEQAARIHRARRQVESDWRRGMDDLDSRWSGVAVAGGKVEILALRPADDEHLAYKVLAYTALREPSIAESNALTLDSSRSMDLLESASTPTGMSRIFAGAESRRRSAAATQWAMETHGLAKEENWSELLQRLAQELGGPADELTALQVITELVAAAGPDACLIDTSGIGEAVAGHAAVKYLQGQAYEAGKLIKSVGESIQDRDVTEVLVEMPMDSLRGSTGGRVRLGPLKKAGFESVQDVLARKQEIWAIAGLGRQSATQIVGAAETMQVLVKRETPLRIDVARRDKQTSRLLRLLHKWATAKAGLRREAAGIASTERVRRKLVQWSDGAGEAPHYVAKSPEERDRFVAAISRAADLRSLEDELKGLPRSGWDDFFAHPADYFGWLRLFGFETAGDASASGQLPKKLIDKVRRQDLDTSRISGLSLRGYQDFGARFALAQKKVVIGDEMGLGKTIEALAFLAHLHAKGARHTLVICPASVVTNWAREVTRYSDLNVWVLHGPERQGAAFAWLRKGGVAVTTFETLPHLGDEFDVVDNLQAVVVDEAHYIKNPDARRTRLSRQVIDRCRYALLLTGTPIENRRQEFENLISYLQPEVIEGMTAYAPVAFPRLVAPAYLRRNQEDVLPELPERIEVDEWLPMSGTDSGAYFQAVREGNFMAMRRAAMSTVQSSKVQRLLEIVAEARANHRKVIVFSYFRDVLMRVTEQLDGTVLGPLNGSVPAGQRQKMVDAFSKAEPGAALVSQITAGGVGLNIQAGSVVILCEPQVKPSMEAQAIARAHRMGQTQTVQVHRLLSDQGVDKRMVEILAAKQAVFDEFARPSHTADTAPEAKDVTEISLATQIIAEERERLAKEGSTMTPSAKSE